MILLEERKTAALVDQKNVESSRSRKVMVLQRLQQLFEKILGYSPSLEIIKQLLGYRNEKQLVKLLVKLYREAKYPDVPNTWFRDDSPEDLTPDLRELYDYIVSIPLQDLSEDPARYWDAKKKKFVPLLLTNEEKQIIVERNKRYVKTEEMGKMYEFAKAFIGLFNHSAVYGGVNLNGPEIRDKMPFIAPFVRLVDDTSKNKDGLIGKDVRRMEIIEERFFIGGDADRSVFDE